MSALPYKRSLVDIAVENIAKRLADGDWPLGARIPTEPELAEQLGVSRNTVREAVRVLLYAGLLEVRQGDGSYVRATVNPGDAMRAISRASLREHLEVRCMLEENAARLAASRCPEADLSAIADALARRGERLPQEPLENFIERDLEFHLAVANASGNQALAELYAYFSRARCANTCSNPSSMRPCRTLTSPPTTPFTKPSGCAGRTRPRAPPPPSPAPCWRRWTACSIAPPRLEPDSSRPPGAGARSDNNKSAEGKLMSTPKSVPDHLPVEDTLIDAEIDDAGVQSQRPALHRPWLLLLGLILVGVNLRPALSSLSPVLRDVAASRGLSGLMAGLLTTLPVACLGLFGPLAPRLARLWGSEKTIALILVTLALGILLRTQFGQFGLFAGSALAGASIGVIGVLLPGIVKRDFPAQVSLMTGVYTMALCLGAALAAGLTVPAMRWMGDSWQGALAIWASPALLALLVWWPQTRIRQASHHGQWLVRGLLRDPLAWQVTLFMGCSRRWPTSCSAGCRPS
ncbi:GntR family transcriptional regulator [Chromobacterium haemolyticum]|nr:GntR family transcriptional regulator [Chromobacterium haemolyticum]